MEITYSFIKVFATTLAALYPLLLLLLAVITLLGIVIGRIEKWGILNALYFAFITATTVGYGDLAPSHPISKVMAILVTLVGIILTGIMVAVGLFSLEQALVDLGHPQ
jgi:voltage-gated potassium channel Kch